ncbi:MAG TPA: hypothetical protein VK390_10340, partial [Propionibacteriaceae bacterium]|nr:hypothetical protein [Propionibacteriaceae bacterium]
SFKYSQPLLLVILDYAFRSARIEGLFGPGGDAVNLRLGREQHDLINLDWQPVVACMIISLSHFRQLG